MLEYLGRMFAVLSISHEHEVEVYNVLAVEEDEVYAHLLRALQAGSLPGGLHREILNWVRHDAHEGDSNEDCTMSEEQALEMLSDWEPADLRLTFQGTDTEHSYYGIRGGLYYDLWDKRYSKRLTAQPVLRVARAEN
jgi:hypothetical protein